VPIFLAACAEVGVKRLIQQSISMVHGGGGDAWADEQSFFPLPVEGVASLAIAAALDMEAKVRATALDWLILRGGLFYGPGTGFDDEWFARAKREAAAPGSGRGLCDARPHRRYGRGHRGRARPMAVAPGIDRCRDRAVALARSLRLCRACGWRSATTNWRAGAASVLSRQQPARLGGAGVVAALSKPSHRIGALISHAMPAPDQSRVRARATA